MAQVVADDLGDGGGGGHIADPPAGHGVGLGHAVDDQGALLDLGADGGQAGELPVRHRPDGSKSRRRSHRCPSPRTPWQWPQLLAVIHHAGGVGGVVQDHALGFGGDGGGELLGGDLEVLGLRGVQTTTGTPPTI